MATLVELLGTYAPGHSLSHGGKDYVFARVEQATKGALTVAYFKRAREAVYSLRGELTDAEFDRQLGRVTDRYVRGEYDWPIGESYRYYVTQGLPELVTHLTGCEPKDALALVEARAIEVLHVVTCIAAESSEPLKKTLLAQADSPEMQTLARLLTNSNGTSSSKPTAPPGSPRAASASSSSRG